MKSPLPSVSCHFGVEERAHTSVEGVLLAGHCWGEECMPTSLLPRDVSDSLLFLPKIKRKQDSIRKTHGCAPRGSVQPPKQSIVLIEKCKNRAAHLVGVAIDGELRRKARPQRRQVMGMASRRVANARGAEHERSARACCPRSTSKASNLSMKSRHLEGRTPRGVCRSSTSVFTILGTNGAPC